MPHWLGKYWAFRALDLEIKARRGSPGEHLIWGSFMKSHKIKGTLAGPLGSYLISRAIYSSSKNRLWLDPWMPMWQFWQFWYMGRVMSCRCVSAVWHSRHCWATVERLSIMGLRVP